MTIRLWPLAFLCIGTGWVDAQIPPHAAAKAGENPAANAAGGTHLDEMLEKAQWPELSALIESGSTAANPGEFLISLTRHAATEAVPRPVLTSAVTHLAPQVPNLPKLTLDGRPLLHWWSVLGTPAMIKQLLKAGADINSRDKSGLTPLMWAERGGDGAIIRLLLANGADPELKDSQGMTAEDWADKRRAQRRGFKTGQTDGPGRVAAAAKDDLMDAVARGRIEDTKKLLASSPDAIKQRRQGFTPLQLAVALGQVELSQILLEADRQRAGERTADGRSLPDLAVESGSQAMVHHLIKAGVSTPADMIPRALKAGNVPILQSLLDQKPPLTWMQAGDALALAVADGNYSLARGLVKRMNPSASPDYATDPFGPEGAKRTASLFPMAAALPDTDLLLLLLGHLSAEEKKTTYHASLLSACDRAAETGRVEALALLLNAGRFPAKGTAMQAALGKAVAAGQMKAAQFLLKRGAKVPPKSPLALSAVRSGNTEMLRLVLRLGADVNATEELRGQTPLHLAAAAGNHSMAQILLAAKANVYLRDKEVHTAADLARKGGDEELAEMLKTP